jgi:hypothetical protein
MTISLTAILVSATIGALFLVVDLWIAGKASKRMGPVRLLLDQMEETNAILKRIEDKLQNGGAQ